jgi:hypothetical protein
MKKLEDKIEEVCKQWVAINSTKAAFREDRSSDAFLPTKL